MGKPRNTQKYPTTRKYLRVKKIPGNNRSYIFTHLPDPLPGILFTTRPDPILKNPPRWELPIADDGMMMMMIRRRISRMVLFPLLLLVVLWPPPTPPLTVERAMAARCQTWAPPTAPTSAASCLSVSVSVFAIVFVKATAARHLCCSLNRWFGETPYCSSSPPPHVVPKHPHQQDYSLWLPTSWGKNM